MEGSKNALRPDSATCSPYPSSRNLPLNRPKRCGPKRIVPKHYYIVKVRFPGDSIILSPRLPSTGNGPAFHSTLNVVTPTRAFPAKTELSPSRRPIICRPPRAGPRHRCSTGSGVSWERAGSDPPCCDALAAGILAAKIAPPRHSRDSWSTRVLDAVNPSAKHERVAFRPCALAQKKRHNQTIFRKKRKVLWLCLQFSGAMLRQLRPPASTRKHVPSGTRFLNLSSIQHDRKAANFMDTSIHDISGQCAAKTRTESVASTKPPWLPTLSPDPVMQNQRTSCDAKDPENTTFPGSLSKNVDNRTVPPRIILAPKRWPSAINAPWIIRCSHAPSLLRACPLRAIEESWLRF